MRTKAVTTVVVTAVIVNHITIVVVAILDITHHLHIAALSLVTIADIHLIPSIVVIVDIITAGPFVGFAFGSTIILAVAECIATTLIAFKITASLFFFKIDFNL